MSNPNSSEFPQPKLQTPNRTMIYYSRPSLPNPRPTQLWPPPQWVTSPGAVRPRAPSPSVKSPPVTRSSQQPKVRLPVQPKEQLPKQPEEQLPKQPEEQLHKQPEENLPKQPPKQLEIQYPKQPEIQLPKKPKIKLSKPPGIQLPKQSGQQCPKSCLQEFTQKVKIPLPQYETESELSDIRLMFRSTVTVNGEKFASPNTFQTRKEAEKDAAGIALKHFSQKMLEEDNSLISEDIVSYKSFLNEVGLVYCKSILHEFATKAKMGNPSYNTQITDFFLPVYVSSLDFNGASYTESGESKKEAEQLVARAVITLLLDVPKMAKILTHIIYSKWKQYDSGQKINNPGITKPLPSNAIYSCPTVPAQVIEAPTIADTLLNTGSDSSASVVPVSNVPPVNEFSVQKPDMPVQATDLQEPASSEVPELSIEFVDPSSVATGPSASKKRRKN